MKEIEMDIKQLKKWVDQFDDKIEDILYRIEVLNTFIPMCYKKAFSQHGLDPFAIRELKSIPTEQEVNSSALKMAHLVFNTSIFPYGKYKGHHFKDVPPSYLHWCDGRGIFKEKEFEIYRYWLELLGYILPADGPEEEEKPQKDSYGSNPVLKESL